MAFQRGDYITDLSGQRKLYRLETPLKVLLKDSIRFFVGKAVGCETNRVCFLKFTPLQANMNTAMVNLKRESRFKFYYPYIEHVYNEFRGRDPEGNSVTGVCVEWVDGKDLSEARPLLDKQVQQGKITEDQKEQIIFRQIIQFLYGMKYYLHYAADSFYHNDLKPENIMVGNPDTGDGNVKIIDFDYAHISGSTGTISLKPHHYPAFSIGYTSPNVLIKYNKGQIAGEQEEIYAAGRILYFWIFGEPYYKSGKNGEIDFSLDAQNQPYCLHEEIGYGLDRKNKLNARYCQPKYEKLIHILDCMCANPRSGEGYISISEVITDLKAFLLDYCGGSMEKYAEYVQLGKMNLLQNRSSRGESKAPLVAYKVLDSYSGKEGHSLVEYAMRDIPSSTEKMISVYNIANTIYYIPYPGVMLKGRAENGSFLLRNGDVFEKGNKKIKITIVPVIR